MQAPKRKTSKSKRNMRRSHDSLSASYAVVCSHCGALSQSHRICPSCGHYRGRFYPVANS